MARPREILTILCSGASLGAYVPGLLLGHQLAARGFRTDVLVLENLLPVDKRDNVHKTKFAFHRNFALARIAQKMATDIVPSLDRIRVDSLLTAWRREGRRRFIVIYGFWMPIIERYRRQVDSSGHLRFDLCHMDAATSVSWNLYDTTDPYYRHIWFFRQAERRLPYRLPVTEDEPLPYRERNGRFLIHGGGWGLGAYRSKIPELSARGIALDVTVYEPDDLAERPEGHRYRGNRYFMIDPNWRAWERDAAGRHHFPPFGQIASDGSVDFRYHDACPEVYPLVRQCQAIISKPGGSTLVDSLSAATPLILLEPYGEYEQKNGELWQSLGFAISYDQWAEMDFSTSVLGELHHNLLLARARTPSYIESWMRPLRSRIGQCHSQLRTPMEYGV
uniref:UDP-N-acetylglucosamine:LPS N-acetylglucosamine transferase n=1 Tax=Candidatus Kentrum sp. UNK TaxID=2126344 RepID=A0A451ABQ5_9GAMM|nr:MAG: hypothetical protein BECKUNK1418G_GA0071005_10344 [Candidatus Kentron sp. UNK]VFK70826.1 MAG: hypothetical protein BECKUNK1418H_GA0071006_10405 [Candidatus Kentron sp. UNK]